MRPPVRSLAPGDPLPHVGVLLACEGGETPVRGIDVEVSGTAMRNGTVLIDRARARPFSARLAPWEASGWEHTFEQHGSALRATLRSARMVPFGSGRSYRSPREVRRSLAHAVWVEVCGRTAKVGEGTVHIRVASSDPPLAPVEADFVIRVSNGAAWDRVSLYLAWPSDGTTPHGEVCRTLDAISRGIAGLPSGARVMVVRGTSRERLYLRAGCAVLGDRGVRGDGRFGALISAFEAGQLERLWMTPPGNLVPARAVLDVCAVQSSRFAVGPLELATSVGTSLLGAHSSAPSAFEREMCEVLHASGAGYGFVARHAWVPSLIDQTPWERERGQVPARTLAEMRSRGRVDAACALAVWGGG